jgi:hypothetical protein
MSEMSEMTVAGFKQENCVDLPVLPQETTLEEALEIMTARNRTAVLTIEHGEVTLAHARGILRALRDGASGAPLSSLQEDVIPVHTGDVTLTRQPFDGKQCTIAIPQKPASDLFHPRKTMHPYHGKEIVVFSATRGMEGERFSVIGMRVGHATLVGDESATWGLIGALGPCICSNPVIPHYYPLAHPQPCSYDDTWVEC